MPAISFSTLKDQLVSGEKKQTIRPFSEWWMRWKKGDRLVGYWKMRTKQCEKLFDSVLSEDPFVVTYSEIVIDDLLMHRDGFRDAGDAYLTWFYDHYGAVLEHMNDEFVVIRWL